MKPKSTTCGTPVLSHSEKTSRHEMYTENIEPSGAFSVCNFFLALLMRPHWTNTTAEFDFVAAHLVRDQMLGCFCLMRNALANTLQSA
jgi:type IV secretory pathway TraG/TraD family ATPase VirD4